MSEEADEKEAKKRKHRSEKKYAEKWKSKTKDSAKHKDGKKHRSGHHREEDKKPLQWNQPPQSTANEVVNLALTTGIFVNGTFITILFIARIIEILTCEPMLPVVDDAPIEITTAMPTTQLIINTTVTTELLTTLANTTQTEFVTQPTTIPPLDVEPAYRMKARFTELNGEPVDVSFDPETDPMIEMRMDMLGRYVEQALESHAYDVDRIEMHNFDILKEDKAWEADFNVFLDYRRIANELSWLGIPDQKAHYRQLEGRFRHYHQRILQMSDTKAKISSFVVDPESTFHEGLMAYNAAHPPGPSILLMGSLPAHWQIEADSHEYPLDS